MAEEDIDAVVFLGDYIYELSGGQGPRRVTAEEPKTLEGYRARYALYRSDENLREAHRLFPWIITWDDHEVQDNYANDIPKDSQPREDFLVRRAAAYQAHYEWLPMPKASMPKGPAAQIYRTLSFGSLANFIVLDGRQYRGDQPCGDGNKAPCAEFLADRTMLGETQEKWLDQQLRTSRAQWNVLANQVRMATVDQGRGENEAFAMDAWAGYEMARQRISASLQSSRATNPIVITGDIHSNWVCDLKTDYKNEKAAIIGTEFIGTSISSGGDGADTSPNAQAQLAKNPHVKFYNNQRGYVRCEITQKSMTADFRVVEKVSVPDGRVSTRASFIVEAGHPESHRA
jgi:alkaline phosphatase D